MTQQHHLQCTEKAQEATKGQRQGKGRVEKQEVKRGQQQCTEKAKEAIKGQQQGSSRAGEGRAAQGRGRQGRAERGRQQETAAADMARGVGSHASKGKPCMQTY